MPRSASKQRLDLIANKVRGCELCPLAGGRTKAVPGEGPSDSRVVFVGEGPGREEDVSGRPFIGRAGKLLDSVLETIGVSREEVYITNVVKCRPPKNRPPTRLEAETCTSSYLFGQIDAIRPQKVVLLGRTAAKVVLGEDRLKSARRKVVEKEGSEYFSTYHPAAILRNPRLKGTFAKDLKRALAAN